MRSTTATPVSLQTAPTPEPHADSLPNNDQPKKQSSSDAKTLEQSKAVDDEISELRRQLPPIDYDAVNNWTDHDADIPCTCKVIELDPPVPELAPAATFDGNNVMEGDEKVLQIEVKLTKLDDQLPKVPPDLPTAANTVGKPPAIPPAQVQQSQPKPPRMKSIFDLDFDDDDDPIHRYTSNSEEVKVKFVDEVKSTSDSNNFDAVPLSSQDTQMSSSEKPSTSVNESFVPSLPLPPPPPIPVSEPTICQRFEVREDPLCPAKAHWLTSKNCVTRYHVDTVHNCFIPNVNGNWSVIESSSDEIKSESTGNQELEELKFVPKYDHMRLDKIPKNMRDFDIGWYRQRKLRKKVVVKTDAASEHNGSPPPPPPSECVTVDQEETGVNNSLSNSSQTNVVIDHIMDNSDVRGAELNCDVKTSCADDGNVDDVPRLNDELMDAIDDVPRLNEVEAMDGQSDECLAPMDDGKKRKGSKRKSVKYKIRKSSSDFSRDLDGTGSGPYDGLGDGRNAKIEAPPTRIILKLSRQVTTDADMEEDDDDDEYDESDDESDGEYDEDDDEMVEDVEDESFKDDLLEYNDPNNCHHSSDNARGISIVENNNDDNEKFARSVDPISTDVMDVDHFQLRRFSTDEPNDDHLWPEPMTKIDDRRSSSPSSSSSQQSANKIPVNHLPADDNSHPDLNSDSHQKDIATTPQSIECDDNDNMEGEGGDGVDNYEDDDEDDKTAEQLPLENNEQLASFNNVSNENESGIRPTDGLEFKEWHEVVRVRSYNDELLTILPYVVID